MEVGGFSAVTGSSQPVVRRGEDVVLAAAARVTGAEPVFQRRAVEPVFRRPALEQARPREEAAPTYRRPAAAKAEPAPNPGEAAASFRWLDLEIIPLNAKPDPRGYSVYSQKPRPVAAPVVLIDTAA